MIGKVRAMQATSRHAVNIDKKIIALLVRIFRRYCWVDWFWDLLMIRRWWVVSHFRFPALILVDGDARLSEERYRGRGRGGWQRGGVHLLRWELIVVMLRGRWAAVRLERRKNVCCRGQEGRIKSGIRFAGRQRLRTPHQFSMLFVISLLLFLAHVFTKKNVFV